MVSFGSDIGFSVILINDELMTFPLSPWQDYGITLASMGRFQLNALIERDTGGFGYFDAISEERVFLPFAWMDEGVEGPSEVGFLRAS